MSAARTKTRIQEAALALFVEQGYDNTTVEQISAAAGVSHMTFFRHFGTKDAVLLDDPYDPVIGAIVEAQPGTDALERACSGLLAAWAAIPEDGSGQMRTQLRIVTGHPHLRARMWENNYRTQRVVAEALQRSGAGRLEAEVAAGACLGALIAALMDWAAAPEGRLGDWIAAAMLQLIRSDGGSRKDGDGEPG